MHNFYRWVEALPRGAHIFDIETDGFVNAATKVHSLVIRDLDGKRVISVHIPSEIERALRILEAAPVLVGHNIINFDIRVLKRLYPWWSPKGKVFDTLNATRLIWPAEAMKDIDFACLRKKTLTLPKQLIGLHSLEAWGYRLGVLKGEFHKETNWREWSPEMQSYCEQDVEVTTALFEKILEMNYSPLALGLEMEFQKCISLQEAGGVHFNVREAERLYADLCGQRAEILGELQKVFPPKTVEEHFIPKRDNRTRGYVKGQLFLKRSQIPFNPNSDEHIAQALIERYQWEPIVYTETGHPSVKGEVLETLPYPEAKLLAKHKNIAKIIGMLAEGKKAWLKQVTPERKIHGQMITNGAVTGRCTHKEPNLGQVPKKGELGQMCRGLFEAPPSWWLVGADASGLELRILAHYMGRHDHGAYTKVILEGDIHTTNQKAAGLPTRDQSKRFIYAFLYGAGPPLLGGIVYPEASANKKRSKGLILRKRFLANLPALGRLMTEVDERVKTKHYLTGLDGRRIRIRAAHAALNALFQSAGAMVVKLATVFWHLKLEAAGYVYGRDYLQLLHVHDEVQAAAPTREQAEFVGKTFVKAIEEAGAFFKLRCPVTGEYKIGRNWKETH